MSWDGGTVFSQTLGELALLIFIGEQLEYFF